MQLSSTRKHRPPQRSIHPDVLTDRPTNPNMAEGLSPARRDSVQGEEEEDGGFIPHMKGCETQLSPQTPLPGWPTSRSTSPEPTGGMTDHIPAMAGRFGANTDPEISPPPRFPKYILSFLHTSAVHGLKKSPPAPLFSTSQT